MTRDWLIRALSVGAYLIALYFSYIGHPEDYDILAFIWGAASLLYWSLTWFFESRDRSWNKEDKEQ